MNEPSGASLSLLEDENFIALMTHFTERGLTWDDFLLQPQPAGIAALHTWNSLNYFGKHFATGSGVLDKNGIEYWYFYTKEMTRLIKEMSTLISQISWIDNGMSAGYNNDIILDMRAQEIYASLRMDDINVSEDHVSKLIFSELQQVDDLDRLIVNMASIDEGLDEYLNESFSIELLRALQLKLLNGVVTSRLPRFPAPLSTEALGNIHVFEIESDLDTVLDFANVSIDINEENAYLRGTLLADFLRLNFTQRLAGACLSSLLSRLYFRKQSQPVMSLIPLTKQKLLWRTGRITPPTVSASLAEYYKTMDRGAGNITLHQTINAQLLVSLLQEITSQLEFVSSKNQDLTEIQKKHPELNHRQISILMRAWRSPNAEFFISFHEKKHTISYATARRDLMQLSDMGYFTVERRGKSFVFHSSERLADLL